jgi:hypothetical protein
LPDSIWVCIVQYTSGLMEVYDIGNTKLLRKITHFWGIV